MADDIRPASEKQVPQTAVASGGPTVADVFLVAGTTVGRWQFSTTGPATAYLATGATGRYEVDSTALAHDAFVKKVAARVTIR